MEARRRINVICSHIRPIIASGASALRDTNHHHQNLTRSSCFSHSNGGGSDSKGEERNRERECVFCKIVRGESPALKLYEDDICLCILDTNPLSPGHSLIIPKSHFPSLLATPPSVVGAMCSKVPTISNAVMKATGSDSFNLLVNNGAAAGQVIFHMHIHIIPRKERDCLWASESLRRQPLKLDQETSKLADCIREQLLFENTFEDSKVQGSSLAAN